QIRGVRSPPSDKIGGNRKARKGIPYLHRALPQETGLLSEQRLLPHKRLPISEEEEHIFRQRDVLRCWQEEKTPDSAESGAYGIFPVEEERRRNLPSRCRRQGPERSVRSRGPPGLLREGGPDGWSLCVESFQSPLPGIHHPRWCRLCRDLSRPRRYRNRDRSIRYPPHRMSCEPTEAARGSAAHPRRPRLLRLPVWTRNQDGARRHRAGAAGGIIRGTSRGHPYRAKESHRFSRLRYGDSKKPQ